MHFADLLKTIAANHAELIDRKAGTPGAGARKPARPPKERGNEEPQTTNGRTGEDGSAASAASDAAPLLPTQADSGIIAIEREQAAEGSGRPGATIHRMDAETATPQGDFLHLYSSVTDSVVSGVTVAANPFDRAASTSDLVISGSSGADTILTGSGDDIVRASGGADTVNTGAGNDIIVIVGQTASGQYAQSDITNPGGSGIDLSGVIALDNLNGRAASEILAGETLDGGAGANRVVIYGNVDLTGVTLTNITQLQVNSTVTISAQQINALGLTLLSGDGGSVLNITNDGAAPITLNLSGISFADFRTLNVGSGVTVVADQSGVNSLQYLTGEGIIKASSGSGTLNLSGKYIALAVQDKNGNNDAAHGGGNFVAGKLLIGSESADTLTGGNAADRIEGGAGNDILVGGNGNDVLRGGAGVDSMDGGAGDDTFVIVGDLSGGGKVDSDADTAALGFKLTTLNGQNLNEDEDGAAEIIRGGDGDDTLYVYGTADLTHYDLTGIEHVEIRSDVKFSDGQISGFKSIAGDGSSIIRIEATGSAPIVVDLAELASRTGLTLSNIGQISVGANVTVKIDSLDRLGGARILTGDGSIEAKTGTVDLNGYTKTATLAVKNANGTAASGAEVLEHVITKPAGSNIITGTSGDDYLIGTDNAETLDSKSGNDYMLGKDGNDTFKISGSGTKIVLDGTGTDTLDLSAAASAAGTAEAPFTLADGGRVGAATVQLGSGSVATGKKPLDVFIAEDLSGSFGDDVSTVRTLLDNLITSIRRDIQPNTAFGAGSFVDKPASTFGKLPDYVYRTDSAISTDTSKVKTAFQNMIVRWGADEPESQLEALYQIALRADKPVVSGNMDTTGIGFRSDAARVVIIATDANYHKAGDWASAGANDGDTVLDGSPPGSGEDYPSVAQVKTALQNANIFPIFAVTNFNSAKGAYEDLVTQLGRGKVVDLASNSADIVSAIKTGLASYKQDFIENLIGTKYDDVLVGNGLANRVEGGEGNDLLRGGGGNDTIIGGAENNDIAVFGGAYAQYEITPSGDKLIVSGKSGDAVADGIDTINASVEYLRFSDGDKTVKDFFATRSVPGITEKYPFLTLAKFADAAYRNSSSLGGLAADGWMFIDPISRISPSDPWLEYGNAAAVVAQKGDSLVVSFRGTDDPDVTKIATKGSDTHDWIFQSDHYAKFNNLRGAIQSYVEDASNGIKRLYVTGHSLGGAMASWYLTDTINGGNYFNSKDVNVFGAAFGAPEILDFSLSSRLLHGGIQYYRFENGKDLVPDVVQLAENTLSAVAKLVVDKIIIGPSVESLMEKLVGPVSAELFSGVVSQFADDLSGLTGGIADYDFLGESPGKQINLQTTFNAAGYLGAIGDRHSTLEYLKAIQVIDGVGMIDAMDYLSGKWNIFGIEGSEFHSKVYKDIDLYDPIALKLSALDSKVEITGDHSTTANAVIAAKDSVLSLASYIPIINEHPYVTIANFINDLVGGGEREWLGAEKYTEDMVIVGSIYNDVLIGDGGGSVFSSDDAFFPGAGDDKIYGDQRNDDDSGEDMVFYPDWNVTYSIGENYRGGKDDSGSYDDFRFTVSAGINGTDRLWGIEKIFLGIDFGGGDKIDLSGIDAKHETGLITIDATNQQFIFRGAAERFDFEPDIAGTMLFSESYQEVWCYYNDDDSASFGSGANEKADLVIALPSSSMMANDISTLISNGHIVL